MQVHMNTSKAEVYASEKYALTTKDTLENVDLWDDTKTEKAVI